MTNTERYHKPVLLHESIDGLAIKENGIYVDVTFGGGGHSREILNRLGKNGRLYAFDQDADAANNAIDDERFTLINQNFRYIKRFLKFYGVKKVDGVLGDFGVSSHQFDVPERGFSTRFEGVLDMRMNQSGAISAQNILNEYSENELVNIFFKYGELKNSKAIAKAIISARTEQKIVTGNQLQQILKPFLQKFKENKTLAQIYQAIRIEVNEEMQVLEEFLTQLPDIVEIGGRISLISYHSLEDRLVKRFIRDGQFEGAPEKDFYGNVSVPFRKVGGLIVPTTTEIAENSRARSAKLRIAERQ
ncbi:16S rRNA (cytosine(1402)-N(4))-methyltransferase RsmH [Capnocytophaga felis]|uniref:Ribosomal RNA small subunit methyltransferase H n=1 Tax=Capnocytophaga felis TaxID=2267611 RepID=A0A5M4BB48_9FLAO|nr:16S rRNA (cytosine(1402)-N(4))-methyltransferase RsmH [Capnocytophaga felis]GET46660.1 ribosomal RNA small subunit methyltransferase H [Capnocytophaga felis]GET48762.1 ribosomal RNA small subunit methyltransferase H [Capnocytophaga felis]